MEQRVFEGPWEEVARHAGEWSGRRVRVIVVDEPAPIRLECALADLIGAAERLQAENPATNETEASLVCGDAVAEKFRAQGFRL